MCVPRSSDRVLNFQFHCKSPSHPISLELSCLSHGATTGLCVTVNERTSDEDFCYALVHPGRNGLPGKLENFLQGKELKVAFTFGCCLNPRAPQTGCNAVSNRAIINQTVTSSAGAEQLETTTARKGQLVCRSQLVPLSVSVNYGNFPVEESTTKATAFC